MSPHDYTKVICSSSQMLKTKWYCLELRVKPGFRNSGVNIFSSEVKVRIHINTKNFKVLVENLNLDFSTSVWIVSRNYSWIQALVVQACSALLKLVLSILGKWEWPYISIYTRYQRNVKMNSKNIFLNKR